MVLLSALCIFCILCGYYVMRSMREEIGAQNVRNLSWFWTATFLAMLAIAPLYALLVARFSRRVFLGITFRFFILNLLIFIPVLRFVPVDHAARVWVEGAYYVWLAVFALFVVSVFWSLMADTWTNEQARRVFGPIAVGGTIGAICGSLVTRVALDPPEWTSLGAVRPEMLLLIPAVLLECAYRCVQALCKRGTTSSSTDGTAAFAEEPVHGTVWEGMVAIARSPYLAGICLYLFLYTLTSSFVYFELATISKATIEDRVERQVLFADIDLAVNCITLVCQAVLTGWIMTRLGVALTLMTLPILTTVGFASLGMQTTLAVVVIFQVARRASNYAFAKPAREVLFTVVPRTDKYKAKSFIDTVVYRGGDALSGWMFDLLRGLTLTLSTIALIAVPIAASWAVVGLLLGRSQQRLVDAREDTASEGGE